jgi:hypothetical protein
VRCEDPCEFVGVPSGELAGGLDGPLALADAYGVDGEVADDGHVAGAVASAQPRLILFEDHVEHPVQAVLDAQWPRTASARRSAVRAAEAPGRGRRARLLDDGLDHAAGRQLGEARLGGVAPVTPP